jgi:hypothetical protein
MFTSHKMLGYFNLLLDVPWAENEGYKSIGGGHDEQLRSSSLIKSTHCLNVASPLSKPFSS